MAGLKIPSNISTPKTIDEAFRNAICIGPIKDVQERLYHHVRDYLAQKFGIAYMMAGTDERKLEILTNLFAMCSDRATMDNVIRKAISIGPARDVQDHLYDHVKNYWKLHFSVAYIEAGRDVHLLRILGDLFFSCINRKAPDASDKS